MTAMTVRHFHECSVTYQKEEEEKKNHFLSIREKNWKPFSLRWIVRSHPAYRVDHRTRQFIPSYPTKLFFFFFLQ